MSCAGHRPSRVVSRCTAQGAIRTDNCEADGAHVADTMWREGAHALCDCRLVTDRHGSIGSHLRDLSDLRDPDPDPADRSLCQQGRARGSSKSRCPHINHRAIARCVSTRSSAAHGAQHTPTQWELQFVEINHYQTRRWQSLIRITRN